MISKDVNSLNVFLFGLSLLDKLTYSSVMVQSAQTSDVPCIDALGVPMQNVSICVSWIGDNKAFNVLFGLRKGFSLLYEDLFVCLKKIFTFHAWFARKTA